MSETSVERFGARMEALAASSRRPNGGAHVSRGDVEGAVGPSTSVYQVNHGIVHITAYINRARISALT